MAELNKYENFVRETANVVYVDGEDVLSESALDYVNNAESVWNKAQPQFTTPVLFGNVCVGNACPVKMFCQVVFVYGI